jgi:hypothetical protein
MLRALFICSNSSCTFAVARTLLAAGVMLGGVLHARAAPECKPIIEFRHVQFSGVQPETLERRRTARLSVDASRCATISGRFGIMFARQKENAPEFDFAEQFVWKPEVTEVSVDFWVDEAVEAYRLTGIAACPCRD